MRKSQTEQRINEFFGLKMKSGRKRPQIEAHVYPLGILPERLTTVKRKVRRAWAALFNPGERVRLRFINASSMTIFDVRIPGLPMTVVQADGNCVQPVTVEEFRIGVAETYDVIVQPHEDNAYTIFAQPEARGRYARGTLAPRMGMTAEIPPMDPYPYRTMTDMGMGGMANMKGMNTGGMSSDQMTGMKDMQMGGIATTACPKRRIWT